MIPNGKLRPGIQSTAAANLDRTSGLRNEESNGGGSQQRVATAYGAVIPPTAIAIDGEYLSSLRKRTRGPVVVPFTTSDSTATPAVRKTMASLSTGSICSSLTPSNRRGTAWQGIKCQIRAKPTWDAKQQHRRQQVCLDSNNITSRTSGSSSKYSSQQERQHRN